LQNIVDFDYFKGGFNEERESSLSTQIRILAQNKNWSIQGPTTFSKRVDYSLIKVESKTFEKAVGGGKVQWAGNQALWNIGHDLDKDRISEATRNWLDEMKSHRSRIGTVAGGPLMDTEINYKIAMHHALADKIQYEDPEGERFEYEAFMKILNGLQHCLSKDNFDHFVSEHKHSSVKPGITWAALNHDHRDQLYDFWKEALNFYLNIDLSKNYWNRPFHVGFRSRLTEPYTGAENYATVIDRSRWIVFEPHQSTLFSVIDPDKYDDLKKDVISWYRSQTGLQIFQAYMDGVDVYTKMSELTQYPYRAYDGISWEVFVPTILPWIKPFSVCYGDGVEALGTGEWITSLAGVLAACKVFRKQSYADNTILLGNSDDMNHIFLGSKVFPAPIPLDESALDTNLKFMLGLSYIQEQVHPIGVKLTRDSSDKHVPYQEPHTSAWRDLSEREMDIVVEVYQGYVNGVPFLDHLRLKQAELDKMDYFSPRTLIDKIVQDELENESNGNGQEA
jgi:hypothetical protein